MYKTVVLTKFREDLSADEVRRWWKDVHGPMARKTPGLVRYVQNYWTEAADPRMFGGATPVRCRRTERSAASGASAPLRARYMSPLTRF